jgi:transposase, IS6 family
VARSRPGRRLDGDHAGRHAGRQPGCRRRGTVCRKGLDASHTTLPRVITVDKHAAYPVAFQVLQQERTLPETCRLRQCQYVINVVEQDRRFAKDRVNPGLGFGAFHTAQRTLRGYEAMHMLRKGQITGIAKGDVLAQNRVINQLFGLAA